MKVNVKGVLMETRKVDKGEKGIVTDGYLFQEGEKQLVQVRSSNGFFDDKSIGEIVEVDGSLIAWVSRGFVNMMVMV